MRRDESLNKKISIYWAELEHLYTLKKHDWDLS